MPASASPANKPPGVESTSTTAGCGRSHRQERRLFSLTSLKVGDRRSPRGRRWRLASGRRKVVKLGLCWPVPRGACGAGGAPAPGSGATTPFPEAGVRKHLAPEGALRQTQSPGFPRPYTVRKHLAPEGALRLVVVPHDSLSPHVRKHLAPEGALRLSAWSLYEDQIRSESTSHQKVH